MKGLVALLCGQFLFAAGLYADDGVPGPQQGLMQTLIMIGIAMLFFYFILWRPEQKRRKALEEQRETMKKGDKVSAMGIIGTVDTIEEHTVVLKMIDGSRIEFLKAAVTDVHEANGRPE
jgi:preprotein translocase subunit YajC